MTRIDSGILQQTISSAKAMSALEREALTQRLIEQQPIFISSLLVLPNLGVSRDKLQMPLNLLAICFHAMSLAPGPWKQYSDTDYEKHAQTISNLFSSPGNHHLNFDASEVQLHVTTHAEAALFQFILHNLRNWQNEFPYAEGDHIAVLNLLTVVECIGEQ